jgi:RimJ/RimL family protein N-acetyltransferase/predicted N-acetyltransferase YhbS
MPIPSQTIRNDTQRVANQPQTDHSTPTGRNFMTSDVLLRDVAESDVPIFFAQQLDPDATRMVAFTNKDHADREAFAAKWAKILGDTAITKKTILVNGSVAGNVLSFEQFGKPSVGYWIGKEYWGKGVATKALAEFLRLVTARPLYARTASDNIASIRVLEKCGFTTCGHDRGFANARGVEIDEVILILQAKVPGTVTLDRVADLSDADRDEVRALSLAVYPPEQWIDWPGRHLEWSTPEWCVRVRGEGDTLVSYVGVYVREAECNGRLVRIGGIGNVKTHPAARRHGFAALGIRRAIEFFREQPAVAFALLVCEPQLLAYYSRFGWREFAGQLLVRQRGAVAEFTFERVMTLGLSADGPTAGTIDLRGPPW